VAIISDGREKKILQGQGENTTHQRMELLAVIKALDHAKTHHRESSIHLYTDSQYVTGLFDRKEKLKQYNYTTKKKNVLGNADLIEMIFSLEEELQITFTKVKAHGKVSTEENLNREADLLSRKIVRAQVSKISG
jgi:ribonuclease HI